MIDPIITELISIVLRIFFLFLVIIDPFASAVFFLGISKDFTDDEKKKAINLATTVAVATFIVFLIIGPLLLSVFEISLESFQIAGGIILLIIGIRFLLGTFFEHQDRYLKDKQSSIMVIGVPLITGPGVLTTILITLQQYGYILTLIGGLIAFLITWVFLKFSEKINKLVGTNGMEISSRIMGLLLAAMAIELIRKGLLTILT